MGSATPASTDEGSSVISDRNDVMHRTAAGPTGVQRLLAPNPGPMTLDGTNTWIIHGTRGGSIIIDPGPADDQHLRRVRTAAGRGAAAIWLTHRHDDHSAGAARMAESAGCPVRAMDPDHASAPGQVLSEGVEHRIDQLRLIVVHTPGHTSDSLCFLLLGADRNTMLTGDTVLGRGTTVIAHPDGGLGAYLASLDRLIALVERHRIDQLLPGHGEPITDPSGVLNRYRQHRLKRLDQVRTALAAGDQTPAEVVARIYTDIDPSVRPAAEQSVRAQLDYLRTEQ